MKKILIYLLAITVLAACKGKIKTTEEVEVKIDSPTVKIEFDAAKQDVDTVLLATTDTAFVVKDKLIKDDIGDKREEYLINIFFSNKNWPKLTYKSAIGADLALAEDLNGDGIQELLLRPEWFSSCWASINLFSLKGNTWKLIRKGSMYFCSDAYPLAKRIVKTETGYGLLTDSLADDKFITIKREIKF